MGKGNERKGYDDINQGDGSGNLDTHNKHKSQTIPIYETYIYKLL